MPVVTCPFQGCNYTTDDVDATVIVALLDIHKLSHATPAPAAEAHGTKQRPPKIALPKISEGSSEETWNAFFTRWGMFKRGTVLTEDEKVQQLFQCCVEPG